MSNLNIRKALQDLIKITRDSSKVYNGTSIEYAIGTGYIIYTPVSFDRVTVTIGEKLQISEKSIDIKNEYVYDDLTKLLGYVPIKEIPNLLATL